MFLCETLLLVLLKLLILHFGLFAVVILCVFRKENGLTVKRTFVFRFSCLFYFQVNIWFEPLNEKTTRNTCVTVICLRNLVVCNLIGGLDEWRQ